MKQKILSFKRDEFQHWVANLSCGHTQHVRHDPPWQTRLWVISERGRLQKIGYELDCVECDKAE